MVPGHPSRRPRAGLQRLISNHNESLTAPGYRVGEDPQTRRRVQDHEHEHRVLAEQRLGRPEALARSQVREVDRDDVAHDDQDDLHASDGRSAGEGEAWLVGGCGSQVLAFPKGSATRGRSVCVWNRQVAGVARGVLNEGEIGTSPTLAAASESQALATK